MDEELRRLCALRPAKGILQVIYPGYKEHQNEASRRAQGISLPADVAEEARQIGSQRGVSFPTA